MENRTLSSIRISWHLLLVSFLCAGLFFGASISSAQEENDQDPPITEEQPSEESINDKPPSSPSDELPPPPDFPPLDEPFPEPEEYPEPSHEEDWERIFSEHGCAAELGEALSMCRVYEGNRSSFGECMHDGLERHCEDDDDSRGPRHSPRPDGLCIPIDTDDPELIERWTKKANERGADVTIAEVHNIPRCSEIDPSTVGTSPPVRPVDASEVKDLLPLIVSSIVQLALTTQDPALKEHLAQAASMVSEALLTVTSGGNIAPLLGDIKDVMTPIMEEVGHPIGSSRTDMPPDPMLQHDVGQDPMMHHDTRPMPGDDMRGSGPPKEEIENMLHGMGQMFGAVREAFPRMTDLLIDAGHLSPGTSSDEAFPGWKQEVQALQQEFEEVKAICNRVMIGGEYPGECFRGMRPLGDKMEQLGNRAENAMSKHGVSGREQEGIMNTVEREIFSEIEMPGDDHRGPEDRGGHREMGGCDDLPPGMPQEAIDHCFRMMEGHGGYPEDGTMPPDMMGPPYGMPPGDMNCDDFSDHEREMCLEMKQRGYPDMGPYNGTYRHDSPSNLREQMMHCMESGGTKDECRQEMERYMDGEFDRPMDSRNPDFRREYDDPRLENSGPGPMHRLQPPLDTRLMKEEMSRCIEQGGSVEDCLSGIERHVPGPGPAPDFYPPPGDYEPRYPEPRYPDGGDSGDYSPPYYPPNGAEPYPSPYYPPPGEVDCEHMTSDRDREDCYRWKSGEYNPDGAGQHGDDHSYPPRDYDYPSDGTSLPYNPDEGGDYPPYPHSDGEPYPPYYPPPGDYEPYYPDGGSYPPPPEHNSYEPLPEDYPYPDEPPPDSN